MKNRNFIESLDTAIEGFVYCFKSQRNMRAHFVLAVLVMVLGLYLGFNRLELLILAGTSALVLSAEMINTAIELTLDMFKEEVHPAIKLIKDISAGSVLITAIFALVVGYTLFFNRIRIPIESGLLRIKQSDWHISLIILIVLMLIVVTAKLVFHRGSPLRGGMPSGHSAFAFSSWTLTVLLQQNNVINILMLIMAVLVARSRLKEHIHTFFEVITGAFTGIVTTVLIFQLLK